MELTNEMFVAGLKQNIKEQDKEFLKRLAAKNDPELTRFYEFICSLRQTVDLADQIEWKTVSKSADNSVEVKMARIPRTGTEGFILREAVREQIKLFGDRKFSTRQMFDALKKAHPNDVDKSRFASVSATLANLFTKDELEKFNEGTRKVTFRAV
ncbi:MAG: hypothetical protein IPL32_12450 [Chloracidobacterium sp.]|nr:hypothetical protein [Chloracidobacterium sp.]